MTDTLLTRLDRYGDDLDRAADVGTPGQMDDDDTSHRRGGVLAFAAACVVLAGMAAVLLIGGGGSGEQPVADESAVTTALHETATSIVVDLPPSSMLEPLFSAPPAGPVSGQVPLEDGTLEFQAAPTGPTGVRWCGPEGGCGGQFTDGFSNDPMWAIGVPPGVTDRAKVSGVVGPNGVAIEVVLSDGSVFRDVTHEVPGVPGPRVFRVNVTLPGNIEESDLEDGGRISRWPAYIEFVRVLDEDDNVIHRFD